LALQTEFGFVGFRGAKGDAGENPIAGVQIGGCTSGS
jgi:hypothetical protein